MQRAAHFMFIYRAHCGLGVYGPFALCWTVQWHLLRYRNCHYLPKKHKFSDMDSSHYA